MDKVLLVNIILTCLTGVYVILTFGLLQTTVNQNKKTTSLMLEQLRLSSLPLINCSISYDSKTKKPRILISNIGDIPAFDLDIWICGILFDDSISKKKLIKKFVLNDKKAKINNVSLIEDGQYGIYERGVYANLPSQRKIDYQTDYLIKIDQFDVFVQYRDNLGNNYAQIFWFFQENDSDDFKLGLLQPKVIKSLERIDLTDNINLKKVPKDFHFSIKRIAVSIPGDYVMKNKLNGPESRWNLK